MASTTTTKAKQDTSPAMSEAAIEAWTHLLRGHARLIRELDAELREDHGSALGDFDVLAQLTFAPEGRLRMCDLASAIVLSPSGLSRRVDRLERAGLVVRERGCTDGRNVEARLSASGKRLFARLRTAHLAGIGERFASKFSEKELATLGELLGRLDDRG
jgi:DNA-binding MarR family transcriptional regulator